MVDRVLLGAYSSTFVLRASRPGFDVKSTSLTPKQLAFSSQWSEASNCFLTGYVAFTTAAYVDVLFGQTFSTASLPIVMALPKSTSNTIHAGGYFDDTVGIGMEHAKPLIMTDRVRFPRPLDNMVIGIMYLCYRNKGA